jgi:uncharacterized membrane protein
MVRGAMSTRDRPAEPDVEIYHPTRGEPTIRATRAAVVILLLLSVVLMLAITIGGWNALSGMRGVQIAYIALYVAMFVQALRWSRGSLPVSAALAVILGILALVSVTSWFNRDQTGFTAPALPETTLGLLCALLVPLQLLLILFAMRGFGQGWNIEEERPRRRDGRDFPDPRARTA